MSDRTRKLDPPPGPPQPPSPPAQPSPAKGDTLRMGRPSGRPGGTVPLGPEPSPERRSSVPITVIDDPGEPSPSPAHAYPHAHPHAHSPQQPPVYSPLPPIYSPTPSGQVVLVQGGEAVGRPDPDNTRHVAPHLTLALGALANRRDVTSLGAIATGQRVGRFVLDGPLGEGSYGQVFRAHDERLPLFQVAVKVIPMRKQSIEETNKELAALATVSHPNIVSLLDHGTGQLFTHEGVALQVAWFAMPLYRGQSLADRLERGPLSPELAHRWFRALASAVGALHRGGLRHQDIKPQNVFVADFSGGAEAEGGEYEVPVLLDLGVATHVSDNAFLAGTPDYFAPEQSHEYQRRSGRRGDPARLLGDRMDVYSLALTLYQALGARPVFDQAFDEQLRESGAELTEAERADAYARALEADPLLLRSRSPLRKRLLPAFRWGPRKRLSEAMKRWFSVDATRRASIGELYDELPVLLGMQELRARTRRHGAYAAVTTGLFVLTGLGGAKVTSSLAASYQDELGHKDQELQALGKSISGCLERNSEAKRTYDRLVDDNNRCQAFARAVQDEVEQGKKNIGSQQQKLLSCMASRENEKRTCEADKAALKAEGDRWAATSAQERARADGVTAQLRAKEASLSQCEASLGACRADAQQTAEHLRAAQAQAAQLQEQLTGCNNLRASCQTALSSCQLQAVAYQQQQGQAAQCQSSLNNCTGHAQQLQAALAQCQRR